MVSQPKWWERVREPKRLLEKEAQSIGIGEGKATKGGVKLTGKK